MANRVFITGDTHGDVDIHKLNTKNFSIQKELDKDDYVIICGDAGFCWDGAKQDHWIQKWHGDKNYTTLSVVGNHCNFNIIEQLPTVWKCGGFMKRVNDSVYYLISGEIYTIGGKTFLAAGGAESQDKEFRKEGVSWWPQEALSVNSVDRALANLIIKGAKVDYILTHTGGSEVCCNLGFVPTISDKRVDTILAAANYKKHLCGHYHLDRIINNKTRIVYDDIVEV